jgi:hypothetical protein
MTSYLSLFRGLRWRRSGAAGQVDRATRVRPARWKGVFRLRAMRPSGRSCLLAIVAFPFFDGVGASSFAIATSQLAPIHQAHEPLQSANFVVALDDAYADADGGNCRSEGTPQYSAAAHALLMDLLAYDRGPGAMSGDEMEAKVRRLVDETPHESVKALLRACAVQFRTFREIEFKSEPLLQFDAQLTRSRIIIYEDLQKHEFTQVLALLTGTT